MRLLATTDETVLIQRLPATLAAPSIARRSLREALLGRVGRPALDDALLVLSELVANSVLHGGLDGGEPIEVRAKLGSTSICLKVIDDGGGFAAAAERAAGHSAGHSAGGPGVVGGRGLAIVDRLALDWAHERDEARTVVWAEVPRSAD
jgi:anti-sigma regulatory factor (Ser/Thr protein kinase)